MTAVAAAAARGLTVTATILVLVSFTSFFLPFTGFRHMEAGGALLWGFCSFFFYCLFACLFVFCLFFLYSFPWGADFERAYSGLRQ